MCRDRPRIPAGQRSVYIAQCKPSKCLASASIGIPFVSTLCHQVTLSPFTSQYHPNHRATQQVLGHPLFLWATMLLGTIPFPSSAAAQVLSALSPTEVMCCCPREGRWIRTRGQSEQKPEQAIPTCTTSHARVHTPMSHKGG